MNKLCERVGFVKTLFGAIDDRCFATVSNPWISKKRTFICQLLKVMGKCMGLFAHMLFSCRCVNPSENFSKKST